jgi:anti-sigma factor RsiW
MKRHIPPEEISAWVDRQLDNRTAGRVEAHLQTCASCRAIEHEMTAITGMFRVPEPLELPHGLWTRVAASLKEEPGAEQLSSLAPAGWPLSLTGWVRTRGWVYASVLALAFFSLFLFQQTLANRADRMALARIDHEYGALASLQAESYNPFHLTGTTFQNATNPFTLGQPDTRANPFHLAPDPRHQEEE